MTRRTHRLAALLAAATATLSAAAVAAADPAPSDPQPKPGSSPSCAALAEPAGDLNGLKDKLTRLVGGVQNGLDLSSLVSLYSQSQDILHTLRDESGKLRGAADEVSEPDLHDSTLSLASTLDEGSDFAEQMTNVGAPKPSGEDLSNKVADLSTHAANSLQRFGESYQKTCGVDLGFKDLGGLAKGLGGLSPAPKATAQQAPSQGAPAQATPSEEAAPASNKSLLAPAPIK
ncbi:MAG: hypothetical protein ACRC20_17060 [Segniliparus sp.]|uniref:hypothetical protein n=1 Tax=Segniliparus sp. TaxID=2804064 RepID=UPI003F36DFF9